MARTYAQDTKVPISKTRAEIDELLRSWRADGIRWTEEFAEQRMTLEFLWAHDGQKYLARFTIALPDDKALRARCAGETKSGNVTEARMRRAKANRGCLEVRTLFYLLRSIFSAVRAKLITPEQIFLPFLVGADGRTVSDVAVPQLQRLLGGGASFLLEALPAPDRALPAPGGAS